MHAKVRTTLQGDFDPFFIDDEEPSSPSESSSTSLSDEEAAPAVARRNVSIAHDDLQKKRLLFFHVNLETGGPKAGVTQLSAVAYSPPLKKVLEGV